MKGVGEGGRGEKGVLAGGEGWGGDWGTTRGRKREGEFYSPSIHLIQVENSTRCEEDISSFSTAVIFLSDTASVLKNDFQFIVFRAKVHSVLFNPPNTRWQCCNLPSATCWVANN